MEANSRAKFARLGPGATSKQLNALESRPRANGSAPANAVSRELVRRAPLGKEFVEGRDGRMVRNRVWGGLCEKGEKKRGEDTGGESSDDDEEGSAFESGDEKSSSGDETPESSVVDANPDHYPSLRSAEKPTAPQAFLNGPRPGTTRIGDGSIAAAYGHAAVQSGLENLEWDSQSPPAVTSYLSPDGILAIAMSGRKCTGYAGYTDETNIRKAKKAAAAPFVPGKTTTGFPALHAALRSMAWEPYTDTHVILTTSLADGTETVVVIGYQHIPPASEHADEIEVTFGRTIDVEAVMEALARITLKAKMRAEGVLVLSSTDGEASEGGENEGWEEEEIVVPQKKKRGRGRPRKRRVKVEESEEEDGDADWEAEMEAEDGNEVTVA